VQVIVVVVIVIVKAIIIILLLLVLLLLLPMVLSCSVGSLQALELLIEFGADVDMQDKHGRSVR